MGVNSRDLLRGNDVLAPRLGSAFAGTTAETCQTSDKGIFWGPTGSAADALQVFAFVSVDANFLSSVDERGHLNDQSCFHLGWLVDI